MSKWQQNIPVWEKPVLGLARTGLIFTRIQEGTQPGGGGWPHLAKQSPVFHTMWCHAGFWWGRMAWGNWLAAGERMAPVLSSRESLCEFVSYFLLICIVVVPVPSVCCSVKLPLSRPTSFLPVSFHSPLRRGEGWLRGAFVAGGSWNQNIGSPTVGCKGPCPGR